MLNVISSIALNFLSTMTSNKNITITKTNFATGVITVNSKDKFQGVTMMYSSRNMKIKDGSISDAITPDSIFLPESVWGNYSEAVLAFVVYNNSKLFRGDGMVIGSKIVSAEIKNKTIRKHPRPIVIRLTVSQMRSRKRPICSFWDPLKSGMCIINYHN